MSFLRFKSSFISTLILSPRPAHLGVFDMFRDKSGRRNAACYLCTCQNNRLLPSESRTMAIRVLWKHNTSYLNLPDNLSNDNYHKAYMKDRAARQPPYTIPCSTFDCRYHLKFCCYVCHCYYYYSCCCYCWRCCSCCLSCRHCSSSDFHH